jgi:hypothetical protein
MLLFFRGRKKNQQQTLHHRVGSQIAAHQSRSRNDHFLVHCHDPRLRHRKSDLFDSFVLFLCGPTHVISDPVSMQFFDKNYGTKLRIWSAVGGGSRRSRKTALAGKNRERDAVRPDLMTSSPSGRVSGSVAAYHFGSGGPPVDNTRVGFVSG